MKIEKKKFVMNFSEKYPKINFRKKFFCKKFKKTR